MLMKFNPLMPVLDVFMVPKMLPMKWNFCQNNDSGRPRLVALVCIHFGLQVENAGIWNYCQNHLVTVGIGKPPGNESVNTHQQKRNTSNVLCRLCLFNNNFVTGVSL